MAGQDGILVPKKISWAALAAAIGLCVQAGVAHYRLNEAEQDIKVVAEEVRNLNKKIEDIKEKDAQDNVELFNTLRKIDKYLCKLCVKHLQDECGICDD